MDTRENSRPRRRLTTREIGALAVVATLLFAAASATYLSLARDFYSASGLVAQYMDALARRDINSALAVPGVLPPGVTREEFLGSKDAVLVSAPALNTGLRYSIVDDQVEGDIHRITVTTNIPEAEPTVFTVRQEPGFALPPVRSSFAVSPLSTLSISTVHATFFEANGFGPVDIAAVDPTVDSGAFGAVASFSVLSPGNFRLTIDSRALSSKPTVAVVSQPGSKVRASVEAEPTSDFTARVQRQVNSFFDECVAQQVLLPSGCPFGIGIENRLVGKPQWSVKTYPQVELRAGTTDWEIVPATMTLGFAAEIQSLFDGSITSEVFDYPMTIGGRVELSAAGDIAVFIDRVL